LSKNNYQIVFREIEKFLIYQVWSDSSKTSNEERSVYYQKAKQWINNFNSANAYLKSSNKPLLTPTTVMEIGNSKYIFVIDEAKLRKGHNDHKDNKDHKDRVVFTVSTKEIELSGKKMLKLPCGHHDGVRFDIDSFPWFPWMRPMRPIQNWTLCTGSSDVFDVYGTFGYENENTYCSSCPNNNIIKKQPTFWFYITQDSNPHYSSPLYIFVKNVVWSGNAFTGITNSVGYWNLNTNTGIPVLEYGSVSGSIENNSIVNLMVGGYSATLGRILCNSNYNYYNNL
jgi:hypothetical protein